MSARPVLRVEGLTKDFVLGSASGGRGSGSLAAMKTAFRRILVPGSGARLATRGREAGHSILRAVNAVSFTADRGEIVGIVGRNGAGKSTLLKILARVLQPTRGRVEATGRMVPLLELGRGFAPDLSVSENILLFGLMTGAQAEEIERLEDRVLELAGLTELRDVPLEECPGGSFIQLCFASMLTFPTDILLADELLAVGDSGFRAQIEQRIHDIAGAGGAVLFVSHDFAALRRVCTRMIWLDRGHVRMDGDVETVLEAYAADVLRRGQREADAEKDMGARILEMRLAGAAGEQVGVLQLGEPGAVECLFEVAEGVGRVHAAFEVWRAGMRAVDGSCDVLDAEGGGSFLARMRVPAHFLNDGSYDVRCTITLPDRPDEAGQPSRASSSSLEVHVINSNPAESVWADWRWIRPGLISPRLERSIEVLETAGRDKARTL